MEFSVTQARFTMFKNTMSAQRTCIYAMDLLDPSLVGRIALFDPKLQLGV